MAKQKIVVRVTMENDKKSRKALRIAVSLDVGYTELMTVGNVEDKKPEDKKTKPAEVTWQINPYEHYYYSYGTPYYYVY
ncbi:hypothetical protein Tco_0998110 [Tanacetum coccineum]